MAESRWNLGDLHSRRSLLVFMSIAAQLAVVLLLLRLLQIEPDSGLLRILPLVFAGFLVHAMLPLRHRQLFFLLLSFAAIGLVLGPQAGALAILIGLVVVGVCHLPIAFSTRIVLLLWVGSMMAAVRAGWAPAMLKSIPNAQMLPRAVLPVIGAMFMFRIIIYLYDLRHEERERAAGKLRGAPASIWTRLSYFFLLPNVCFLFFPIVDYRTYRRSHYARPANTIYQQGVWWICFGILNLLLYRLVYHYVMPAPEDVQGLGGVTRFLVGSYLIYLRVVGQFHVIIGMLCLFGFDLPPAHRMLFLAAGFTDFWRRARIEFKDFMVKVFYYPAVMPLQRRMGPTAAMVLATIVVFAMSAALHSYQWFWLRGDLRFTSTDAVFWTVFGGCVLANMLWEARRGKRAAGRTAPTELTVGAALVHSLKVLGMFVFLCGLWSFWSSPTFGDWLTMLGAARQSGVEAYLVLAAAIGAVLGLGTVAQIVSARIKASRPKQKAAAPRYEWRPLAVAGAAALMLLVGIPAARGTMGGNAAEFALNLRTNRLNAVDQERQDRGYYETLLDQQKTGGWLATATAAPAANEQAETPAVPENAADIVAREGTLFDQPFVRKTNDLLTVELLPSYTGTFRGQPLSTNRWGMRDKEYDKRKPAGTYRIALLGASVEMASGAHQNSSFEATVETWLNGSAASSGQQGAIKQYEILNFAVGGYGFLQDVIVAEKKAVNFEPDAIFVAIHTIDRKTMLRTLISLVEDELDVPWPELKAIIDKTGARTGMSELELRRRIGPISDQVVSWCFRRIAQVSKEHNATPIALVVPTTDEGASSRELRQQVADMAKQAGLAVITLQDAFQGAPVDMIRMSPSDNHPNDRGHQLLARALFDALRQADGKTLRLGLPAMASAPGAKGEFGPGTADGGRPGGGAGGRRQAPKTFTLSDIPPLARAEFSQLTGDVLVFEFMPSYKGSFANAPFVTNSGGMHDREYARRRPRDTYRIAVLGSAYAMGPGVPGEGVFEALLEERLNREGLGGIRKKFEILNFGVMNYSALQHLAVFERKVLAYQPDAVLLVIEPIEVGRLMNHLNALVTSESTIEYAAIRAVLRASGVKPSQPEPERRRRLQPVATKVMEWSLKRMGEIGRKRGVRTLAVTVPRVKPGAKDQEWLAGLAVQAKAAGFVIFPLNTIFANMPADSVSLRQPIVPNARAHQLIANRLYEQLRAADPNLIGLGGRR